MFEHRLCFQLRLYGVIQAFRDGRLPDNAQIDHTLKYVLNHSPVDQDKLSPDGRKLVQDVKDIIETARVIVNEKNDDELFQNFIWHTRDVETDKLKRDPKDILPENQTGAADKEEGSSAPSDIYRPHAHVCRAYSCPTPTHPPQSRPDEFRGSKASFRLWRHRT